MNYLNIFLFSLINMTTAETGTLSLLSCLRTQSVAAKLCESSKFLEFPFWGGSHSKHEELKINFVKSLEGN